jgi:hypothetical protein
MIMLEALFGLVVAVVAGVAVLFEAVLAALLAAVF